MSSQSYNATAYSGFTMTETSPTTDTGPNYNTGLDPGFPLRDASDYTRMRKERLLKSYSGTTSSSGVPAAPYDVTQSNMNRLLYNFRLVRCAQCDNGGFPRKQFGS